MTAPDTPPAFSPELEELHTAARADLNAAATSSPTDHAAWCRRVAEARRTLADLYQLASGHVARHSLTWWALRDASLLCDSHAIRLLNEAANNPKGQ